MAGQAWGSGMKRETSRVLTDQTNKSEHTHTHTQVISGYTSDCANTGRKYKRITNKDAWACTYELMRTDWVFWSSCVWEDFGPVNISFCCLTSRSDSVKESPADTQTHLSLPFNGCLSALVGGYYHQLWVFSNLRCRERLFNFHLFFHIFTEDFSSSFYFEEIGSNSQYLVP